ncbi:MAG TPA: iron ABC transporter permease [Kofleriaceae bacterium]|nr:iron ABC transporter permease [Kofleriaceae bacterium]
MTRARASHLSRRRLATAITVGLVVVIAALVVCPLIGAGPGGDLGLLDVGDLVRGASGEPTAAWRLYTFARLPRAVAACVVGAGLAAAGCALQSMLRNPLAEPYTLGISSGAALFAVLAIRLGADRVLGSGAIDSAAFIGAAAASFAVWQLGRVGRNLPPATLLLAGVTVAMFCAAASMLVLYTSDFAEVYRIVGWMMGGLDYTLWPALVESAVPIAVSLVALLWVARDLNALAAGADAAASVGVIAQRAMAIAFVASAIIVGASVSLAGAVGFVGLIVPHAARAVVGPDHRVMLPVSILAGGAFLVIADTLGRVALAPRELPVGIVTALMGGPFFLYVLYREKSRGRMWGAM